MELEGLAARHGPLPPVPDGYTLHQDGWVLDFTPLLAALLGCRHDAARGAALFHATLAAGLADWVLALPAGLPGGRLAVGGGCAMNAVLMAALRARLGAAGITLFEARLVPPNDGGLALGQAWLARQGAERVLSPPDINIPPMQARGRGR
jgi:hydrogenase maturation protein HypF